MGAQGGEPIGEAVEELIIITYYVFGGADWTWVGDGVLDLYFLNFSLGRFIALRCLRSGRGD